MLTIKKKIKRNKKVIKGVDEIRPRWVKTTTKY